MHLPVVFCPFDDGEGAVELFQEEDAEDVVGEGHVGEGEFKVDGWGQLFRESGVSADEEDQFIRSVGEFFREEVGEFRGVHLFPVLVQGEDEVVGIKELSNHFAFFFLFLCFVVDLDILDISGCKGDEVIDFL